MAAPMPPIQTRPVRVDVPRLSGDPLGVDGDKGSVAVRSDLRQVAEGVGASLRTALEEVVLSLFGPSPRPTHLINQLGLDKSLAGRIIQTLRSSDPLGALSRCPSPVGLELFLNAAARAGAQEESIERLRGAVGELDQLLGQFPRGRAGLEAAISGWKPQVREQGERTARHAAFNAMSFILGYQSDVTLGCTFLKPSADGESVDASFLSGQFGLRRLRAGEPLSIFGMRYYPLAENSEFNPNPTTLDGQDLETASCLLEEFCRPGVPRIDVVKTNNQRLFVLPADQPPLNEPISMVIGHRTQNSWERYRSPERHEEWLTMLPRCPTRVYINDCFIRDDVYVGVEPVVTTHIVGVSPLPARERGPSFPLDEVHLAKEAGWVRNDIANIGTGEIPRHPDIISTAFQMLGEDPRRYRVHRLRMMHPVSGIVATRWFKLPDRPQA